MRKTANKWLEAGVASMAGLAVVWTIAFGYGLIRDLFGWGPFGFFDWIVHIQTHGQWHNEIQHSREYYIARWGVATTVIWALGLWAFLWLRRQREQQ